MPVVEEYVDAVVVGAGHAGCEAALACARLGLETAIFTVSVDSIALRLIRHSIAEPCVRFWKIQIICRLYRQKCVKFWWKMSM